MNEPDKETLNDIKRWYQEHGMEYDPGDWTERSDTGESAGEQTQQPERSPGKSGSVSVRSTPFTAAQSWWWEDKRLPWAVRSYAERDWLQLLEDFFAPYIAMLPRPKGNLVEQVFIDQRSYAEVAEGEGVYDRSGARKRVRSAVRDLTRLIANDDPLFRPPADGRQRDYDEETRAARRVFVLYLERRSKESPDAG